MKGIRCLMLLAAMSMVVSSAHAATVFKIATVVPEGTMWMKEMRAGAAELKTQTQGRVEIKYFPGGVMGSDSAVIRKIKLGQLQGGAFPGGEFSAMYKDAQAYGVPFLFRSLDEVDRVRKKIDPMIKSGAAGTGWEVLGISGGFAYLMSTKPIKTSADLRATKVWVPQNDRIALTAWQTAKVSPISLSLADVLPALQTGMIETVGNVPTGAIAFQWHTKLKQLIDLPLTYATGYLAVDKKAFDKLTPADQAVMRTAMGNAFARIDAGNRTSDLAALGTLQKQGLHKVTVVPSEEAYWRNVGVESEKTLVAQGILSAQVMSAIHAELNVVRGAGAAKVVGK